MSRRLLKVDGYGDHESGGGCGDRFEGAVDSESLSRHLDHHRSVVGVINGIVVKIGHMVGGSIKTDIPAHLLR